MGARRAAPKDVDDYIARFPSAVQEILTQIRETIREAAPQAAETISYQIPAFMLEGPVIYFAAFKAHVSVYPAPREAAEFTSELAAYKGGKGTVQFPLDRPIPFDLIRRIVRFRVQENLRGAAAKRSKKR